LILASANTSPKENLAVQRSKAQHRPSMFLRMLVRGVQVRRGRALTALLAVVVAAAVSTAMLNLYVDVGAKLRREFRSYGANVVVAAKDGEALPPDALAVVQKTIAGRGLAVPFAYAVAHTATGRPVIVAGADLDGVQRLDRWWSVTAWPGKAGEALVGTRAVATLAPAGKAFDLVYNTRTLHLQSAGILRTGADEDSRVYLPLPEFTAWTGVQAGSIEISYSGTTEEITALAERLRQALPQTQVQPVRPIVEAEAHVLGKTQSSLYAATVLIILTAMLCVLTTLTGWIYDRRADFAIMKALGASEGVLRILFVAEALSLGAVGALLGFVIGIGVAAWIGRVNFHAAVMPRFSVLPVVLAGSLAVALLSALFPMSLLRRVQPAMILRGE
jgi:putative ABC transport system permease protein